MTQEKLKELEIMYQNALSVFLDTAKFAIWWKMLISAEPRGCVTWFIYLLDLP